MKNKKYNSKVLSDNEFDYIHKTTLLMLKSIIQILDKEAIRYFVCGGTLRGALLLNGFIPWDEDIDICVLDEDYDRMTTALLNSAPDWFLIQCNETEANYYHGWIKVRDKMSHIYPDERLYYNNGVLIDIYKICKVKRANLDSFVATEHLEYLKRRLMVGGIEAEEFYKRIDDNKLISRISNVQSDNTSDYVYIVLESNSTIIDAKDVFPVTKCVFENLSLPTFHKPEAYLIEHYGLEYYKLPNKDNRYIEISKLIIVDKDNNAM